MRTICGSFSGQEDGRQALALLAGRKFDLILLDIMMPQVDGFQVLQKLKEDERTRDSPVLVISALGEAQSVSRCIEAGAEDYLTKPVDAVLLRARVNSCLQKRRMRLREMEQFFPPEVARALIDNPHLLQEGREADVTVLFCDIRGFSRISEVLEPGETVEWVSAVMEALSECVLRRGGVVVDFIGDELVAMWGAPTEEPNHRRLACLAALDMLGQLPQLNRHWEERIGAATAIGIGLNSGPARVGNTGTRRRFKYGPLGNTVNLASRVQGATKYLKAPLIVTGATRAGLDDSFATRRLAQVQVVNIQEPVDLYEVAPAGHPDWPDLKRGYENALQFFEVRLLKEAAERLGGLITRYGAQGPTLALMSRTVECLVEPSRWKKVWDLPGK